MNTATPYCRVNPRQLRVSGRRLRSATPSKTSQPKGMLRLKRGRRSKGNWGLATPSLTRQKVGSCVSLSVPRLLDVTYKITGSDALHETGFAFDANNGITGITIDVGRKGDVYPI